MERIAETLSRYEGDHPVYDAVTASRASQLASSALAKRTLGPPKVWPVCVAHR